jgi:dephospho-CoA kinase
MRRDESPRATIEAIIAAQVPREVRISAADDIIDNNGEASELVEQVNALHARYLSMAVTGRDNEVTT